MSPETTFKLGIALGVIGYVGAFLLIYLGWRS